MSKKKSSSSISSEDPICFPHYLDVQPKGEDLFEGHSQEMLASSISEHIIQSDKVEMPTLSRLIGLKGKWGSGKTNVIKILESKLGKTYSFFFFDAWGNQEDLQRRSILELLTKYLIDKGKLSGKTKIRVFSPVNEGHIIEDECTWSEKLESLLSRKSFTKEVSVPSVNTSTKWFVLTLLVIGFIISFLSVKSTNKWWLDAIISLSPLFLFTLGMLFAGSSWKKMFAMYNVDSRSDTTSFVISEQEPSVREFKDWMKAISNSIPKGEKIVLVFDNMDRLPSEKVHQFWSLIQTFFSDDGYSNIWCIVPYDEKHLAAAFSSSSDVEYKTHLLRGYLDKTFPIVYRVPDPIVSDYRSIFERFYRDAFGTTVSDEELGTICRCYRLVRHEPIIRDIISFVNSNVMIAKLWKGSIHPVSIAVYVLKVDEILSGFNHSSSEDSKPKTDERATDEYIVSEKYLVGIEDALVGSGALDYLQKEISAIVYGIEPNNAYQIVVNRFIRSTISGDNDCDSFDSYVDQPQFMSLLDENVRNGDADDIEKTVMVIASIDSGKLSDTDKVYLTGIWNCLGKQFIFYNLKEDGMFPYHEILFNHLDNHLLSQCLTVFCERLIKNDRVKGDSLFHELKSMFSIDAAKGLNPHEICPRVPIETSRFIEYVQAARNEYSKFPLYTNPDKLNKVIRDSIGTDFKYMATLKALHHDSNYNVSEVAEYADQHLRFGKELPSVAYHFLRILREFNPMLKEPLSDDYVNTLWRQVQGEVGSLAYQEIYAMKASSTMEQLDYEPEYLSFFEELFPFYVSTASSIKQFIDNPSITFRREYVKHILENNIHDGNPDYPEFIEKWEFLASNLGLSRETIIRFADDWGLKDIPEQKQGLSYFTLLPNIDWIDALLLADTPLSKVLLSKCADELDSQAVHIYVNTNNNTQSNSLPSRALSKLCNTIYIRPSRSGTLNKLAAAILDCVARTDATSNKVWLALLEKVKYSDISSEINDIRNGFLNGHSGYVMTPNKFKQLHKWLEFSGIDSESHCSDTANQILAKVVNDADCQSIILSNKGFYSPIIEKTVDTASVLHEKLKSIIKKGDSEFADFIKSIVDYQFES